MGTDKAGLRRAGASLLEHTFSLLGELGLRVYVSVRPDQTDDPLRREYPLIPDRQADLGPAGGMLAAHDEFPDHAWLVTACDLPMLSRDILARLLNSRDTGFAATVFQGQGRRPLEPLCAIYEPATLARLKQRVDAGKSPSPTDLLQECELKLLPHPGRALNNINSPADLADIGFDETDE